MDAVDLLKNRRSIRKFKPEKVSRELMTEILEIARWAPSWANYQIARYTLISNPEIISKLATDGVNGFVYNINTLKEASNVAVLSFVEGKSGKLDNSEYITDKGNEWEIFDAGIACQTFCLAAFAKGVGTCVMGVIDDTSIARIIHLPKDQKVAALIVYGFVEEGVVPPTPRKDVNEIAHFLD